ncbi:probable glutathione S-transferase [Amaranthus tricolor]|uniref:probable glutathione S-transferase n=1 Tax=Amaranthus tricolor TaxID=29722 RepID=UPI00258CDD4D|nr:probable glutathione S-transferase [Amaranthus tricolor]
MGKVQVYGFWVSPYSKRVEIALKMKGIDYEVIEEDLQNKSEQLLKYNPVHKKIPVLVHDGNPIVESLLILEYVDEVWKTNPLLPTNPYQKAYARFWARFIDDKITPTVKTALMTEGEESEKALEELHELLNILENEIKGKKFFGGENIGYLDIVASMIAFWIPCLQEVLHKEVITKEKYPSICNWTNELLACSVVNQNLPNKEKLLAFYRARFANKS